MKTPDDKTIALTFGSHPTRDLRMRWTAVITFPAGSTESSVLPIAVRDGNGDLIADAVFEFAGRRLKVKAGAASIGYGDFVRGKHSVPLWLHRPGMPPVPGGLTFA